MAENAERYMLECRRKSATNANYEALHDEHLAKFFVFNYLHGRIFLATREGLLAELRSFLRVQQTAPLEAFDANRFLEWRQRYVASLIRELEEG